MLDQKLVEELHKPINKKLKKMKLRSPFIVYIWSADLADMQLISKFNKGVWFFYVFLIFSVNMHGLFL